MQITQQQRADAIQRESLQVQREVDIVQEAARRENLAAKEKESLRAEALQREKAIRDDARNRDKLFFDSNDRDKDRAMKEMARREELVRNEAEKRMILMQELAEEKRRSEIEKIHREHEREKRHEMQKEVERIRQEKVVEREHAKAKKTALKLRIAEVTAISATGNKSETVSTKLDGITPPSLEPAPTAPIVVSPQKVATPALSKVSISNIVKKLPPPDWQTFYRPCPHSSSDARL